MSARRLCLAAAVLGLLACADDRGPRPVGAVDGPVDAPAGAPADLPLDAPADLPLDAPADLPFDSAADATADAPGEAAASCSPPGSVCRPGRCEGNDHFVPESICDQSGVCQPSVPIACNPTRCRNGSCVTACTSDDDCFPPARCTQGSCRGWTMDCTRSEHCASGFCVEGVCCDRACTSPCETCALPSARGRCSPRPAAALPDAGCAAPDAGAAGGG